jgi:hypothetical protein
MLHIANRSAMGLTDAVGAVNRSLLAGPTLHCRRISIHITLTPVSATAQCHPQPDPAASAASHRPTRLTNSNGS